MKKIFLALVFTTVLWSCKTANTQTSVSSKSKEEVAVNINLTDIKNDKVLVTINAPSILTDTITFRIPKTVPGTYSTDNYGRYIDDLKAYDSNGNSLEVKKIDLNSWSISKAKTLDKITYWVNDTFETETETGEKNGDEDIFSPAGSNIDAGKNVMLNTHCFVGYFTNFMSIPYQLTVSHPAELWGATSMIDQDSTATNDVFISSNYAELVENPIMYAKPDYTTFTVNEMEILIAVYSPTGKFTAESITPEMKTLMTAQKHFMGNINSTKKYSILLYLSSLKNDALASGALEHPTATTVVFPEIISKEQLITLMKDVVSHEFFHTITPLTIHSQEIQNFDYNAPKMSKHLWMYEGITEYFSNLFQINQGLIDETEFYKRITEKIENSKTMDDTMAFTTMSANVLTNPFKDQYLNVYEKGALIGMCIDIIIREKSNGTKGVLDLMRKLSNEYGVSKAFNDDALFAKITQLTYPEVGDFLETHVSGPTPIPYEIYLAKMGVTKVLLKAPAYIFEKGNKQYIAVTDKKREIIVNSDMILNDFFTNLGLLGDDIIIAVNDKNYTPDIVDEILYDCENWKENDPITLKIKRNGVEKIIKGTVKLPYEDKEGFKATDNSKSALKEAWLKG
ncbi:Predicted metalloprotease, contains C-terminal PDZ domain [Flavobacterium fluvii]|uniref:Predicted metalloprotease, contains C-terminal PDZ domain n=1 Tax=Flavobacterium fluvii TaxID=468056 RepID=A0A1M5JRE5_9FLAO|nr:peptidase M61 [Flavobacterium fluvii]SHG43131.1 Predicted metalloprotease, contains C-terminal PDZ domain [Flavobacterium fluvii]